jgi:hypothetical protein
VAKKLETTGRAVGTELGRAVRHLEKEATHAAKRGRAMQDEAVKQSVRLMRRIARRINRLALQLEKTSKSGRSKKSGGRSRRGRKA